MSNTRRQMKPKTTGKKNLKEPLLRDVVAGNVGIGMAILGAIFGTAAVF
jgi:hypothetical protein